MTFSRAIMTLFAFTLVLFPGLPEGAENDPPRITGVRLYLLEEELAGDVQCRGIFSERVVQTVRSGLPAVVEVFYHLVETREGTEAKGVFRLSLHYDVWDDIYSVTVGDTSISMKNFESLRAFTSTLRSVPIVPARSLLDGTRYRLRCSIAVNPLRGTDRERIEVWVREKVRSDNESSWREQLLNVNELISYFFSREKNSPERSSWFVTEPFRLSELKEESAAEGNSPGEDAAPETGQKEGE
jgi:hypothetical protein